MPACASANASLRFGVFSPGDPYGGDVAAIDALQAAVERHVDIVHWYQSWGGGDWISSVQPHVIMAVTASGRTPLLTWEPWSPSGGADQPQYRLSQIAGGAFDAYITGWADALRAVGATIYLRPMHEMNGTWYPWSGTVNGNSSGLYIQAWLHIHAIFRARGAHNVKWVWSPNHVDVPQTSVNAMERYYPGREYVDVLAVDGYNWGAEMPHNGGWQSYGQVFSGALDRLSRLGSQPLWIAEIGCDVRGGDKAAWIRDALAHAKANERVQALIWFDVDKERDWRATSSADVAAAFKP